MIKDDFAFIEYTSLHSAYRAMTELNGYRLGGCKLQIEEAKPRDGETYEEFFYKSRTSMHGVNKMYRSITLEKSMSSATRNPRSGGELVRVGR